MTADSSEVKRIADEAKGREDESVLTACTFRAEALEREARGKNLLNDPSFKIARDLRTRLTAFRKAHPSPSERLHSIAAQRRQIIAELERAREHWFHVYGWRDKQPRPAA